MTDVSEVKLENPTHYAEAEITKRLTAIGCQITEATHTTVRGDKILLTMAIFGRDDQGHASEHKLRLEARPGDLEEIIKIRIERVLKGQESRYLRSRNIEPVILGPDMPLSHLEVSLPYARRLRIDHAENAQNALRSAIIERISEGRSASKSKVQHQPAINLNQIDHREQLGENVWLKSNHLIIENTTLPEQLAIALVGRPIETVCEHPILNGETIHSMVMSNVDAPCGRRTVDIRLNIEWLRADEL